jgi:hypothetical protein
VPLIISFPSCSLPQSLNLSTLSLSYLLPPPPTTLHHLVGPSFPTSAYLPGGDLFLVGWPELTAHGAHEVDGCHVECLHDASDNQGCLGGRVWGRVRQWGGCFLLVWDLTSLEES